MFFLHKWHNALHFTAAQWKWNEVSEWSGSKECIFVFGNIHGGGVSKFNIIYLWKYGYFFHLPIFYVSNLNDFFFLKVVFHSFSNITPWSLIYLFGSFGLACMFKLVYYFVFSRYALLSLKLEVWQYDTETKNSEVSVTWFQCEWPRSFCCPFREPGPIQAIGPPSLRMLSTCEQWKLGFGSSGLHLGSSQVWKGKRGQWHVSLPCTFYLWETSCYSAHLIAKETGEM